MTSESNKSIHTVNSTKINSVKINSASKINSSKSLTFDSSQVNRINNIVEFCKERNINYNRKEIDNEVIFMFSKKDYGLVNYHNFTLICEDIFRKK